MNYPHASTGSDSGAGQGAIVMKSSENPDPEGKWKDHHCYTQSIGCTLHSLVKLAQASKYTKV